MTGAPPDAWLGVGLALLSTITFGSCIVLVSIAMRGMGTGPGSLLSVAAGVPAGLLLVLLQLAIGAAVATPSGWALFAFMLAGILSTYLGRWLVFKSIELIGPSGASALQSTSPMITALFAWVFIGERIGWMGLFGIAIGIVGLVSLTMGLNRQLAGTAQALAAPSPKRLWIFGTVLFGIASSTAYSGSYIFRASAVREWNEPLLGTTIGAVAGLIALAIASRGQLPAYRAVMRANPKLVRLYLGIGVLQFIAQSLVIASMKYIPASVAALISMCTPLIVMPISYFVLKNREKLSWLSALGICITLAGMALVVLHGAAPGR